MRKRLRYKELHILKSSVARCLQWRIYYYRMCGQLSTTCSNLLKYPIVELLVVVDRNQLRTLVPLTDRTPNPHGQYSQCASCLQYKSVQSQLNRESILNFSMRGNHLEYAATLGMSGCMTKKTKIDRNIQMAITKKRLLQQK